MKTIDTLVADIYGLFGTDEKFDLSLFDTFGENLKQLMDDRFHQVREGSPTLRMSNIGKADRQLWLDLRTKYESREKLPSPTMIKFAYGDIIEQMILLYAKMAGHKVEFEQGEISLDGIKGHLDAVIDGVVVDVKSASSFSFLKFESGALLEPGNDPFGYLAQLSGYVEAKTPGAGGAFLAVDKTLGKLTLLQVPASRLAEYDVRRRIAHVKEMAASDVMPPKCCRSVPDGKSGNMKLDVLGSYCAHKEYCWPELKTYYYSTGPKFLTVVAREPRVNDFETMK